MTSEEIKNECAQLPDSDPMYAAAEWLQEIAYQLAVMNERKATSVWNQPIRTCSCSLCHPPSGGNLS
jgi:hypothetical protein